MSDIAGSLRHASGRLLAAPAFSTSVTLTLALGIGATTAVFSVVNAVLLRPLPYSGPDRLMSLSHSVAISGVSRVDQSDATLLFYRGQNRAFTDISGYRTISVNFGAPMGASGGVPPPERVLAGRVSAGLFAMLGVAPLAGRGFMESEDRAGAPAVVVIGEQLWRRKYAADPLLVGRVVAIHAALRGQSNRSRGVRSCSRAARSRRARRELGPCAKSRSRGLAHGAAQRVTRQASAACLTSAGKSENSCTWRISITSLSEAGQRDAHSIASSFDLT
jgi:hypothetical protein